MSGTRKPKAQNKQQQFPSDLGEKALELTTKIAPLDADSIKALRLTCKLTKAAADARVWNFTLSAKQEPAAVQRSGLMKNIKKLKTILDLIPLNSNHPRKLSRALGLLHLAAGACSNSVEVMDFKYRGSPDILLACASILGNSNWESLKQLVMGDSFNMTGCLSGILARPGSLPALKELWVRDPSAADLELLIRSAFIGNLTDLTIHWSNAADQVNTAPATVAAMRNLLQKAKNLKSLNMRSRTFNFFDLENLNCLNVLTLEAHWGRTAAFAQLLARPWMTLTKLSLNSARLNGPDLVRLFEAEDTLPVLTTLEINGSKFAENAVLTCVRRPHLEKFSLYECSNSHGLISQLAQLMKEGTYALPSLRDFVIRSDVELSLASVIEALTEFLSCPCMAALESLSIIAAHLSVKDTGLLCIIANKCHKLKYLNLQWNKLGKPAVALLLGYGQLGAWPELKRLDINQQYMEGDEDLEEFVEYMQTVEVGEALRQAWPGLDLL